MAEESTIMQEAIVTMYELSQEEKIREQCLARILYDGDMNGARQNGFDAGRIEGRIEGQLEGEQRISFLNQRLIQADRMDDLVRSVSDLDYRRQLLEEFGL